MDFIMAEYVKKLQLYSNTTGTTETAKIYSATSDLISGKPYMPVEVAGVGIGYVQLDSVGASNATKGRVFRTADEVTYQICSQAGLVSSYISSTGAQTMSFTVPEAVTVLLLYAEDPDDLFDGCGGTRIVRDEEYEWLTESSITCGNGSLGFIRVTPGKTYSLTFQSTYAGIMWSPSINNIKENIDEQINLEVGTDLSDITLDNSTVKNTIVSYFLTHKVWFEDLGGKDL